MVSSGTHEARPQRRDIQGLRSIAVLVVFADHLVGKPSGGFVGVDVFFVISGFLITGLLLREYDRTGHISFRRFYVGRAKRIFPAATATLVVTVLLAQLLFAQQRANSVTWDALWSFLFAANWNLAASGTDYFQQGDAVSPLAHYWSLSVEEQFYFVWPWLLLGILVAAAGWTAHRGSRVRAVAAASIGVIIVVSLGWALFQSVASPTTAYFSTFTRAWELGIGALLAVAAPMLALIPSVLRPVLAWAGLVGIALSLFVIGPQSTWPAPWALLPTVSAAVVITSGIGGEARFLWPLTNRGMVFVGDISYSLYLWHFPVIVFGSQLYPDAGRLGDLIIVVAAFTLAIAQYYAIERPIWKSPLWTATPDTTWATWRTVHRRPVRAGAAAAIAVIAITVGGVAAPAAVARAGDTAPAAEGVLSAEQNVRAGLALTTWPELTPSIDEVGPHSKVTAWADDGCLALEPQAEQDFRQTASRCVYGDANAERTAILLGDSIAISWLPSLIGALGESGWNLRVLTMAQCPASPVGVITGDGEAHPECDDYHRWVLGVIERLRPDAVLVSQADATLDHLASGVTGEDAVAEVTDATNLLLSELTVSSPHVVMIGSPPAGQPIAGCYTKIGSPRSCISEIPALHHEATSALRAATDRWADHGVAYIDADPLFCADGKCPSVIDGVIVKADNWHLTEAFAQHAAGWMRTRLLPLLDQR